MTYLHLWKLDAVNSLASRLSTLNPTGEVPIIPEASTSTAVITSEISTPESVITEEEVVEVDNYVPPQGQDGLYLFSVVVRTCDN